MIGLTWDVIDWEKCTLAINKTLKSHHKQQYWRADPPKIKKNDRIIPLTNRAYEILKSVQVARECCKESDSLDQILTYIDR